MSRTKPIIAWKNRAEAATVTASSETADGAAANAVDGFTYDYWTPSGSGAQWIRANLPNAEEVACAGVAAHNASTTGVVVTLQYLDGSTWRSVAEAPIGSTDRTMFVVLPTPITAQTWRFKLSAPASLGVIWLGPVLELQRYLYQGHTPATLADDSEVRANRTIGGNVVGTSVVRRGRQTEIQVDNLEASWVRDTLAPFLRHFDQGKPFFWAWHVDEFPDEVVYAWKQEGSRATVTNQGGRALMDLSLPIRAYRNGAPLGPIVYTTTPYAVQSDDVLAVTGDLVGATLFSAVIEGVGLSGDVVGGSLVSKLVTYTEYDPEAVGVSGDVVGGEFQDGSGTTIVEYSEYDPEAVDVSGDVVGGSIEVTLITYSNYDPEAVNVSGDVVGGTLE